MNIAECSFGIPRHKLLFDTIRIEKGTDDSGEFAIYTFKDGSHRVFRKGEN